MKKTSKKVVKRSSSKRKVSKMKRNPADNFRKRLTDIIIPSEYGNDGNILIKTIQWGDGSWHSTAWDKQGYEGSGKGTSPEDSVSAAIERLEYSPIRPKLKRDHA